MCAVALGPDTPPQAPAPAGPPHRELDFLVGNWLARDPAGRAVATLTITREYAGCVYLEKRRGAGNAGETLGAIGHVADRGAWRRDALGPSGFVLTLEGAWDGTRLALSGKDYQDPVVTRLHRMTWTPRPDGSIEELWQTSTDAGQRWQTESRSLLRRYGE
jgi:hypothetical protein